MIRAAMGIPEARIAPLHVRLSVVCGICGSSDGCMYCLGCFWISYITEITTVSAGRRTNLPAFHRAAYEIRGIQRVKFV